MIKYKFVNLGNQSEPGQRVNIEKQWVNYVSNSSFIFLFFCPLFFYFSISLPLYYSAVCIIQLSQNRSWRDVAGLLQ